MTAARSTPAPAQVIAGRYRIEAKLGEGGMGSVWRAQHLALRSPVAIKLIDPSLTSSEEALARFLLEAQSAAALRSPHVVQILDHGVDKGVPYIAMELLEGESLSDRLKRRFALTPAETARIMTHTARAMSKAHAAGVVHRDLKPDNIFLVRNEDEEIAKVLDFGIAKATADAATSSTRTGMMLGTSYYMSPEQIEGSKVTDHRTDLWAMAAIAFECLIGERAFDGETVGAVLLKICAKPIPVPSQLGPVPPGFDEWFARATARAPSERFQSAREMADALRAVLTPGEGQTLQAMPPNSTLVTTNATISKLSNSGVVVRDASTSPEMATMPTIPPPNVTSRTSRLQPLLIAVGCVVVLAVAALLLRGGPSDEQPQPAKEQPQMVQPTQPVAPPQSAPAPAVSAAPVQAQPPMPSPSAAPAQAVAAPAQASAPSPVRATPVKPSPRPQPKRPVRKAPDLGF